MLCVVSESVLNIVERNKTNKNSQSEMKRAAGDRLLLYFVTPLSHHQDKLLYLDDVLEEKLSQCANLALCSPPFPAPTVEKPIVGSLVNLKSPVWTLRRPQQEAQKIFKANHSMDTEVLKAKVHPHFTAHSSVCFSSNFLSSFYQMSSTKSISIIKALDLAVYFWMYST